MLYIYLADLVVLLHFLFVLFVILGGCLVYWKRYLAWLHIPAVIWGAGIELLGWICPLTPLENMLRGKGGEIVYATGFVEHYIIPVLYPADLTRRMQVGLGIMVLAINIGVYLVLWRKLAMDRDNIFNSRRTQ